MDFGIVVLSIVAGLVVASGWVMAGRPVRDSRKNGWSDAGPDR